MGKRGFETTCFEPCSSQISDIQIYTCRFLARRSALLELSKYWLAQCQDHLIRVLLNHSQSIILPQKADQLKQQQMKRLHAVQQQQAAAAATTTVVSLQKAVNITTPLITSAAQSAQQVTQARLQVTKVHDGQAVHSLGRKPTIILM